MSRRNQLPAPTPLLPALYVLVNPATSPANITETAYYRIALTAHYKDPSEFRFPAEAVLAKVEVGNLGRWRRCADRPQTSPEPQGVTATQALRWDERRRFLSTPDHVLKFTRDDGSQVRRDTLEDFEHTKPRNAVATQHRRYQPW